MHHALLDLGQRVVMAQRRGLGRRLERKDDPLHHRVEEIGLVLEVPIDGAPRRPGLLRDLLQRGLGDPLRLKQQLRGIEQSIPRRQCFFLRTTCHQVS